LNRIAISDDADIVDQRRRFFGAKLAHVNSARNRVTIIALSGARKNLPRQRQNLIEMPQ
jgi:hypothetical protein